MSDKTFTTRGNEPLEARIVAWVLGEASAFEIDELERLCKEQPELAVFKRRIEAVHGLAAEAHRHADDARWKLSSKKRAAIEALIGAEEAVAEEVARDFRAGQSGRRALLAIAACLVLTVVVASVMTPVLLSQRKMEAKDAGVQSAISNDVDGLSSYFFSPQSEALEERASSPPSRNQQGYFGRSEALDKNKNGKEAPKAQAGEMMARPVDGKGEAMAESKNEVESDAFAAPDIKTVNELRRYDLPMLEQGFIAPPSSVTQAFPVTPANPSVDENSFAGGSGGGDYEANGLSPEAAPAPTAELAALASRRDASLRKGNEPMPAESLPGQNGPAQGGEKKGIHSWLNSSDESSVAVGGQSFESGKLRSEFRYSMDTHSESFASKELSKVDSSLDALGDSEGLQSTGSATYKQLEALQSQSFGQQNDVREGGLKKDLSNVDGVEGLDDLGLSRQRLSGENLEGARLALREKKLNEMAKVDPFAPADPASGGIGLTVTGGVDYEVLDKLEKVDSKQVDITTKYVETLQANEKEPNSEWLNASLIEGEGKQLKGGKDESNLSRLAEREMIRRGLDVSVADQKFVDGRKAFADGDYSLAAESFKVALQGVPDAPMFAERRAVFEEHIALAEKAAQKQSGEVKPRPIVTDDEIVAAEEPYSTFSLNINDASFRVAQAALARGEMPDPAGIKVEQFYNAVDYGDPSPAAGQPVACNIEQSAHPIIPGRNLVRVALKTASQGRNQGQPLRLTLLIDQSGSMAREDRRAAMVEALEGLRGLLSENDQVNVIGFARTPRLLAEAVNGKQGQLANLLNIEANEGGTNLEEAIKLGEQLAQRHQLDGAQNRLVLFTDGAANLGDADPDSLAEKIKDLRQKGIAFDIAGIVADGLNDELLGEMARHGNGRYYVVGKGGKDKFAEQIAGAFRPAAENVKVQVHFNPERVGRYKLIGFEKDRLNKEDFRNDAVDAAELAAEEAGVAIYQVEILPEGEGEIGEVSVRFRDLASGEMVERGWTIANEIATPALDQASPSMQLATLAMMTGEKLRGGALGEAINFNDMGEVIAKVNQHYKGDPKAAEMLQMVEQLK